MALHKCAWCPASYSTAVEVKRHQMGCPYTPDPRDAEIARLKAEVETAKAWQGAAVLRNHDMAHILIEEIGAPGPENVDETARRAVMLIVRLRRALAAGPAALRESAARKNPFPWNQPWHAYESAAVTVEVAQRAAMKDDAKEGG